MYTIKVNYHTGDSFNSYDADRTLSGEWTLEVAKENLQRIKSHYNAVKNRDNYYSLALQHKAKSELENIMKEPWYCKQYWEGKINLLENDSQSKEYNVCWTGYFESLISATVININSDDDDMSFTP